VDPIVLYHLVDLEDLVLLVDLEDLDILYRLVDLVDPLVHVDLEDLLDQIFLVKDAPVFLLYAPLVVLEFQEISWHVLKKFHFQKQYEWKKTDQ
jgi:hypothetical protein